MHTLIAPYIKTDATSFYTFEQTEKAFEVLKELSLLRSESIRKQLDGKLARNTDEQNIADRVDASKIIQDDLNNMEF